MTTTETQIRLAKRVAGLPGDDAWPTTHEPAPGEISVAVEYVSLDPAMRGWMNAGKLHSREHIAEGIESFPATLRMLFAGENTGKLMIRI